MTTDLKISVSLSLEDEDVKIKLEAVQCILVHIQIGTKGIPVPMSFDIFIGDATADSVKFSVGYGGSEPASFYYNRPPAGEHSYLSIEKGARAFCPQLFVGTLFTLRRIDKVVA